MHMSMKCLKSILLFLLFLVLSGCAGNSAKLNGRVDRYDDDSTLVELTYYSDGERDGLHWLRLDDSTVISETWTAGEMLDVDTLRTFDPVLYDFLPTEKRAMDVGKVVSRYSAKTYAVTAGLGKQAAENVPDYKSEISAIAGFVRKASSEILPESFNDMANSIIDATERAAGSGTDYVVDGVKNLPDELDSNFIFATYAGIVRGFSVGYQETEDLVEDIMRIAPEVGETIWTNAPKSLYDSSRIIVERKLATALGYFNKDSLLSVVNSGKEKIEEIPGLAEELLEEFEQELELAMDSLGISREYRGAFAGGFLSGFGTWHAIVYKLTERSLQVLVTLREATASNAPKNLSALAEKARRNRRIDAGNAFRTPKDGVNGHWKNPETQNRWLSDLPEVKAITRGKPVPFYGSAGNKMPDFSEWSRGSYKFKAGVLTGDDAKDFDLLYEKMAKRMHISKRQAKRYMKKNGLTAHHADCNELQLIPTALHENVPHTGAASMLSRGMCKM